MTEATPDQISNYLNKQITASYKAQQPSKPPESPAPAKRKAEQANGTAAKRQKPAKDRSPPTTRLSDLGGIESCIERVLELIAMPILHPEVYERTGVRPPRGILLCGPPGCGKTMLASAIAGEVQCPFINVSAPSIVSGMSGESEKALRDTFQEAAKLAPCILFIDEIDAITPKRETAQREMERRIVAQLLTCMDDLSWEKTEGKPVIIVGATNRPDSLDPALRRGGRFDHEINMGVPDEDARERILRVLCRELRLSGDFDYRALANRTPGYVGADLTALTSVAGIIAVKRIFRDLGGSATPVEAVASMSVDDGAEPSDAPFASLPPSLIANFLKAHPSALSAEQLEQLSISNEDFTAALEQVQPSSKREGFTTVPDVTWADVGAMEQAREVLRMSVVQPILRPQLFARLGVDAPCGVLLWGPPGCGKTLVAKAVANESRANFISVKGPELLNKYVGESERAVRQVFARAQASAPCIIFFDELDALVPRRDDSQSEASARVVNTLLTELDGLEPRRAVHVIAATNRPDIVDPAMVRPGRLDKLLYVDLPSAAERKDILAAHARRTPLHEDVDLGVVAADNRCEGFSGADLAALVREAAVGALQEALRYAELNALADAEVDSVRVSMMHFDRALNTVSPSVSAAQRRKYEHLRSRFSGQPVGKPEDSRSNAAAVPVPDAVV